MRLKAIVTGSNGNLGKHIKKLADFEVVSLGRNDWNNIDSTFDDNIDVVIHCAYDSKNKISQDPSAVLNSNIITTTDILKLCQRHKVRKFIFVSSCSVYGHSSKSKEDITCVPVSINGLTKLLNEEIIKSFCNENNIEFQILRVFNSYGGDDQFSVIQKMIESIKESKPFTLFNDGLAERDFIHIEDVAKIICHLTPLKLSHNIINIGTGKTISIIDVAKALQNKFGNLIITNKKNANEVEYSRADTSKLNSIKKFEYNDLFQFIDNL